MKIVVLILLYCSVLQARSVTPESIEGARVVTASEVRELSKKSNIYIIDSRSLLEYSEGHIPGAITVPVIRNRNSLYSYDIKKISKLKAKSLIFYCNGVECPLSYNAIVIAKQKGCLKKLYWFRGGMEEWIKHSYEFTEGINP